MSGGEFSHFTHDACDIEVFWCVDSSHAFFGEPCTVFFGDDSTNDDWGIDAFGTQTAHHIGHELQM